MCWAALKMFPKPLHFVHVCHQSNSAVIHWQDVFSLLFLNSVKTYAKLVLTCQILEMDIPNSRFPFAAECFPIFVESHSAFYKCSLESLNAF